ncbi:immunity protein Imm33 domain-containing protein [Arthrobacter woluwensis]|uniref:immunity protein Imm33 domain-containing protein n=1 Tax=Arthrobacter woluwensis TaxID=156980 RepID=UPI004038560B
MTKIETIQRETAERFGTLCMPPDGSLKVGIAKNVLQGLVPLNALRHPPQGDTSGWYIWAGEELSEESDFFAPLHLAHLHEWCPEILPYLALPPGWRILLAPGYEDVWFDDTLLVT